METPGNGSTANDFIIVSEEQAAVMEKAGIPVEIQYLIRLSHLQRAPAPEPQPAAPTPQPKEKYSKVRVIRYPSDGLLRWTGLKWTGHNGTALHGVYQMLSDYFKGRDIKSMIVKRETLNTYLATEHQKRGKVFYSHNLSFLCNQKYLEAFTPPEI